MLAACLAPAAYAASRQHRQLMSPAARGPPAAALVKGSGPGDSGARWGQVHSEEVHTCRWRLAHEERQAWGGHCRKPTWGNEAIYSFPAKSFTGLSGGRTEKMMGLFWGPGTNLKSALIDAEAFIKPHCRLLKCRNKVCFVLFFPF